VLLVVGLKMARLGGLQVLKHLKDTCQRGFSTVLLLDTQDHDRSLVTTASQLGVESFLITPLEKKEFGNLMSQFHAVMMDGSVADAPLSQTVAINLPPDGPRTGTDGSADGSKSRIPR
jgi:DNA-binding NarL/FixJ family response regulator